MINPNNYKHKTPYSHHMMLTDSKEGWNSLGDTFFIYWIKDLLVENPVGGAKIKIKFGKNLSDDLF